MGIRLRSVWWNRDRIDATSLVLPFKDGTYEQPGRFAPTPGDRVDAEPGNLRTNDSLQANLVRLLEDPVRLSSPAERTHASTMLTLCEDLRRLTREYLGDGPAGDHRGEEAATAGADGTRPTPD